MDYGVISQPLEVTNSQDQIAFALRSAYFGACGIRQRSILPGDPKVLQLFEKLSKKLSSNEINDVFDNYSVTSLS